MARASLQVLSGGHAPGMAAAPPDLSYLSSLRKASRHLPLACPSRHGQRLGGLARLLEPRLPFERLPRLCRLTQYCPTKIHLHPTCSSHWTLVSSFHS